MVGHYIIYLGAVFSALILWVAHQQKAQEKRSVNLSKWQERVLKGVFIGCLIRASIPAPYIAPTYMETMINQAVYEPWYIINPKDGNCVAVSTLSQNVFTPEQVIAADPSCYYAKEPSSADDGLRVIACDPLYSVTKGLGELAKNPYLREMAKGAVAPRETEIKHFMMVKDSARCDVLAKKAKTLAVK